MRNFCKSWWKRIYSILAFDNIILRNVKREVWQEVVHARSSFHALVVGDTVSCRIAFAHRLQNGSMLAFLDASKFNRGVSCNLMALICMIFSHRWRCLLGQLLPKKLHDRERFTWLREWPTRTLVFLDVLLLARHAGLSREQGETAPAAHFLVFVSFSFRVSGTELDRQSRQERDSWWCDVQKRNHKGTANDTLMVVFFFLK